jgi:hypothetical protein
MTASVDSFPRPEQLALTGAADLMPKPFSFEELLARVEHRIRFLNEAQADSGPAGCPSAKSHSTNSNSGRRWNSPSKKALCIRIRAKCGAMQIDVALGLDRPILAVQPKQHREPSEEFAALIVF